MQSSKTVLWKNYCFHPLTKMVLFSTSKFMHSEKNPIFVAKTTCNQIIVLLIYNFAHKIERVESDGLQENFKSYQTSTVSHIKCNHQNQPWKFCYTHPQKTLIDFPFPHPFFFFYTGSKLKCGFKVKTWLVTQHS